MRDEESVIDALEPVVLLSGNPECHSSLLAYLCLPKASGQLISLAHMDSGSTVILTIMSLCQLAICLI